MIVCPPMRRRERAAGVTMATASTTSRSSGPRASFEFAGGGEPSVAHGHFVGVAARGRNVDSAPGSRSEPSAVGDGEQQRNGPGASVRWATSIGSSGMDSSTPTMVETPPCPPPRQLRSSVIPQAPEPSAAGDGGTIEGDQVFSTGW